MPPRLHLTLCSLALALTASTYAMGQPLPARPEHGPEYRPEHRQAAVDTTGAGREAAGAAIGATDEDAAPRPESGAPDPETPQVEGGPAPRAPGAPAVRVKAEPPLLTDPALAVLRLRLAALTEPRDQGGREDLAAARAYYDEAVQLTFVGIDGFTQRAKAAIGAISHAADWGLEPEAFELPAPLSTIPTLEQRADAEQKLALAVLKYARHARGGRLEPNSVSRKFDQKPVLFEPRSVLEGIAAADAADAFLHQLHPIHPQFHALRKHLVAARAQGDGGAKAASLVRRLLVNMERWRWMPPDLGTFHVFDSIPEQMTYVVKDGKRVLAEKIVVGKTSSPTPVFSADMKYVIFHPSWGVPSGIKAHELAPRLRASGSGGWFSFKPPASAVLRAHGLTVTRGGVPINPDSVDWSSANIQSYSFTQAPGPRNVLGIVKFRFPNKHDVYMHDTTERNLFGSKVRAFSHGCMRVQNPMHLAEVLLEHDKGWSKAEVQQQLRRGADVELTTPIPVHVTYFTQWVDDSGKLVERSDLYGLDSRVASALERRQVRLLQTSAQERVDEETAATPAVRARTNRTSRRPKPARAAAASVVNPLNTTNPFGN